jgi:hypothetical protein
MSENDNKTPEAEQADETTEVEATQEAPEAAQDDPETFPREYVEKLRKEAAEARTRAKRADDLARELFAAKVTATGRLADPSDLAYDEALVADSDALNAAIDALLTAKPHLASRTPRGDVGQGPTGGDASHVDLAALLRAGA